jgi:hypothetical protein
MCLSNRAFTTYFFMTRFLDVLSKGRLYQQPPSVIKKIKAWIMYKFPLRDLSE